MRKVIIPSSVFNPQKSRHGDPRGVPWSHAIIASGRLLFISGQTSTDLRGKIRGRGDIVTQTDLTLQNLRKVVTEAGFEMKDVAQLMWFVTDAKSFYSRGASGLRRKYFAKDYPASTLVEVKRLADPAAMVEVQAIAVR